MGDCRGIRFKGWISSWETREREREKEKKKREREREREKVREKD